MKFVRKREGDNIFKYFNPDIILLYNVCTYCPFTLFIKINFFNITRLNRKNPKKYAI